jgi:excisionase family DNA binding protein
MRDSHTKPRGPAADVAALLRAEDIAERCAVSLRTVRGWIASGRLPVLRLGLRCVRIAPEELARFLAAAREGRP